MTSTNTHPVGNGKINRSVTLPEIADAMLPAVAREMGLSVNEFIRQSIAHYAAARKSAKALALRAAIGRQGAASLGCLLMVGLVWVQSICGAVKFERGGRGRRDEVAIEMEGAL